MTGRTATPRRVHLVTLGCPKNQVDSEVMLGVLAERGHEIVLDPAAADTRVVNTCSFIQAAKEESIDAVLELARAKASAPGNRLVVTGCLAQRYADELRDALPEVDVFLGTGDLLRIADAVEAPTAPGPIVYRGAQHVLPERELRNRVRTGAWWTAYVKVSEGCDHTCSFCIIPKIRGRHESRPMDDVLAEATRLAGDGALELNLIAQDLTAYGRDRRDGASLAMLLRALATRVSAVRWIRLLYAYPSSVTDDLLEVMASEPAVCRYLDMPLQHISDHMLRSMRRERSGAAVRRLVARIRAAVPGIALRSSFIVGFPGETDADVDELCLFLDETELDNVGVFTYSREEGTVAAEYDGHVPERVKTERRRRVMGVQARVAARRAAAWVGQTVEVLVERAEPRGRVVGRTAAQAPAIDGVVTLATPGGSPRPSPGDLVRARVTGVEGYDLRAEILAPFAVDLPPLGA
jgi:ribosomal protein S12 methylthiotransferase